MKKESILIIDDEKDLLKLLQYNLEKEGYEPILSDNGLKGIELAKSKKPDLIILDLMLPQIDGFEICRLLKSSEETRDIPVVMLTAKSSEVDQVVGLEMGAVDYLTKPFSVKVLLVRIKNILKSMRNRKVMVTDTKSVVTLGDFMLDQERFRFTVQGKPVVLTNFEFKIMASFLRNPGIVISRDRLASEVWGKGFIVSPTAINMHVSSLRKKLGKQRKYLESVRGFGYRLAELQER